jgi:hypothetical protein
MLLSLLGLFGFIWASSRTTRYHKTLKRGPAASESVCRVGGKHVPCLRGSVRLIPPSSDSSDSFCFALPLRFYQVSLRHHDSHFRAHLFAMFGSQDPISSQNNIILLQLSRTIDSFLSPVDIDFTATSRLCFNLGFPPNCQCQCLTRARTVEEGREERLQGSS